MQDAVAVRAPVERRRSFAAFLLGTRWVRVTLFLVGMATASLIVLPIAEMPGWAGSTGT